MNKVNSFLQKHRWKIVIIFSILYWGTVSIFLDDKRFWLIEHNVQLIKHIIWYSIILQWMLYTPERDGIEIYFNFNFFPDIETILSNNGFKKHKESKSKLNFKKEISNWQTDRIVITKNDHNIWSAAGKESNLKDMEKFMVRYK